MLTYRTTQHSTTGCTPASLFLGRPLRTRLDLLKPDLEQRVCKKQAEQVSQHDQHARYRTFAADQPVLAKNFRPGPLWVSGRIVKKLAPLTYLVEIQDGAMWRHHVDHLRAMENTQPCPTSFDRESNTNPPVSEEPNSFLSYPAPLSASATLPDAAPQAAVPVVMSAAPPPSSPSTVGPTTNTDSGHRYPSRVRKPPVRYS